MICMAKLQEEKVLFATENIAAHLHEKPSESLSISFFPSLRDYNTPSFQVALLSVFFTCWLPGSKRWLNRINFCSNYLLHQTMKKGKKKTSPDLHPNELWNVWLMWGDPESSQRWSCSLSRSGLQSEHRRGPVTCLVDFPRGPTRPRGGRVSHGRVPVWPITSVMRMVRVKELWAPLQRDLGMEYFVGWGWKKIHLGGQLRRIGQTQGCEGTAYEHV